jgi:hypothetical protein
MYLISAYATADSIKMLWTRTFHVTSAESLNIYFGFPILISIMSRRNIIIFYDLRKLSILIVNYRIVKVHLDQS